MFDIKFYLDLAWKSRPYLKFYLGQIFYLVRKGKFKNAFNYFWTIAFTKEDGAALLEWKYRNNPNSVPYPGRIELEVTTVCPLKCEKCEHTFWDEQEKNMTYSQLRHILSQFPKLKAISCSGIGHGFNNPEFPSMLKYIKSKQLFTQFFDPLLLINEDKAKLLINLGVEKIWMSIDGATKQTYEKQQLGSNFETIVKNVKQLTHLKKEMKSRFPELAFHFIVNKENVHEMPMVIDLIHDMTKQGKNILNVVQFTKMIPFKENKHLSIDKVPESIINETIKRAKGYNNFRLSFCNSDEKLPISECTAWTVPFITVEGDYYPCCAFTEGNVRNGIRKYLFGNLFKQSFKEIWSSKEMKKLIWDMHNNKVPPVCAFRDCPMYECRSKS